MYHSVAISIFMFDHPTWADERASHINFGVEMMSVIFFVSAASQVPVLLAGHKFRLHAAVQDDRKHAFTCTGMYILGTGIFNSSNAEATFVQSTRMQRFKPCHVGIHWIALTEYSQMSTHLLGFRSFFRVFASFCIDRFSHPQH